MKTSASILALVTGSLMATGCVFDPTCSDSRSSRHSREEIVASGNVVSEDRSVSSFSRIRLEGIGKVLVKQGPETRVRVEADDNVIKDVITEVENRTLAIKMDGPSYKHPTVRIYVTISTLEEVKISGAGDIATDGPVQCGSMRCMLSGAGNITLTGKADELDVSLSGAGNFNGSNFEVQRCEARVSGVGNCEIYVMEELDAVVSGVGNITYDGNPPVVHQDVTGFGKIRKR